MKRTMTITLDIEDWYVIQEALDSYDDKGWDGETWKSTKLAKASKNLDDVISSTDIITLP